MRPDAAHGGGCSIRLVFSRTVLYLLLTGGVVLAYEVLVALLNAMLRRQGGVGSSVLATVLIAVGFNPLRTRLQRLLDRAWAAYGSRSAPVPAAPQGGARLVDTEAGLGGVVEAVRSALRLPFVALRGARRNCGARPNATEGVPTVQRTHTGAAHPFWKWSTHSTVRLRVLRYDTQARHGSRWSVERSGSVT
jgi:hypothetical protein